MNTVDILAEHLTEWPKRFIRIVQCSDGVFHGVLSQNELAFTPIKELVFTGIPIAEDEGVGVTFQEWSEAQLSRMGNNCNSGTVKQKSDEEYLKENLYSMKLQCLSVVLGKMARVEQVEAEIAAASINSAFDKITF